MKTVKAGQSFGLQVLVSGKPFAMTAHCYQKVELVSLSKDNYQKLIEKSVKRDIQCRITFLKSFRIFQNMSTTQLEKLLSQVELRTVRRGKVMFKIGDKTDGVYLIQDGSFEVTKPKSIMNDVNSTAEKLRMDPMMRFKLRKNASVIRDKSLETVRIAILGMRESFGLEECPLRTNQKPQNRSYTVTCVQNDSKVIFISTSVLAERVVYDTNLERDISIDVAVKNHLHMTREEENQQTIWNGKLLTIKQVENAIEEEENGSGEESDSGNLNEKQLINSLLQDGSKSLQGNSIFATVSDAGTSSRP